MNDEQLEALLRAADDTAGPPVRPSHDLPLRVRRRKQRNDRRRRRVTTAAVLLGGYLAGLATTWLWSMAPSPVPEPITVRRTDPVEERSVQPAPAAEVRRPQHAVAFPRTSAYESLRRLGDEYLNLRGDVTTALEFYRRALDEAAPDELAAWDEGDSWLLRSLKRDRLISSNESETGDAI